MAAVTGIESYTDYSCKNSKEAAALDQLLRFCLNIR